MHFPSPGLHSTTSGAICVKDKSKILVLKSWLAPLLSFTYLSLQWIKKLCIFAI